MEDEEYEINEPPAESMEDANTESAEGGESSAGTKPHWRKAQNGKWVLSGPQGVMTPGAVVEVFRKDGSSSKHKLSEDPKDIGEPFDSRDVPGEKMVYVYNYTEVKADG